MDKITLVLCGDILISRRIAKSTLEKDIVSFLLRKHECIFGNLETTIHNREGYPAAFPGGGYSMADPSCLTDLRSYGFNLLNTANNHSMDYSCNGLMATIKYLNKEKIAFAGTGKNLSDASRPVYFECEHGRVAMLGLTSSFHDSYLAGPQNQEMMGRPGVSPLRHQVIYELDEIRFQQLEDIANMIGINNQRKQAIKEGYAPKTDELQFGNLYQRFKRGASVKKISYPYHQDLSRTIDWIKDAKDKSDVIIVSVHSHQFDGSEKTNPPEFIRLFSHACIDAGADIIVSHGPHLIRGIEEYSGGVIFYGLGNFIFQHEYVEFLPEEYYQKFNLTRQSSYGTSNLFEIRSAHHKKGLKTDPMAWESFIPSLSITKELIDITIYPIGISIKSGLPFLSKNNSVLERINNMSGPFSTSIDIDSELNIGKISIYRNK